MFAALRSRQRLAAWLFALAMLAGGSCDEAKSCKPGTVFVQVESGANATANQIDVDVAVNGGPAMRTSLAIPPGSRSGGVEVDFPSGYPSGASVEITVSLVASGTVLSMRTSRIVLSGACATTKVVFPTITNTDGGSGDGADADDGGGGEGGTAGAGGEGGAGGSVGGDGGGPGGTGGVGGSAGTGGTAGTGGGGSGGGGTSGTGGPAGRGGVGGTGGTGGRGGTGGTGGMCVPTGGESCFNNRDDDCDGLVDCEDTDCGPNIAQCVGLDALFGKIGLMVDADAPCPSGYTDTTTVMKDLTAAACVGCSCMAPAVTCSATVASFKTLALCNTSSNNGVAAGTITSGQTCSTPTWSTSAFTAYGVAAGAFTATAMGSCIPSGSPTPSGSPSWGATRRFCATTTIGGGCGTGQACLPTGIGARCVLGDGSRSCAAGQSAEAWFTGYRGTQTCDACSCTQTAAASCNAMTISIGSDHTCAPQVAILTSANRRACFAAGVSDPGVQFMGTPTRPTCQGTSAAGAGTLAETGAKTLCCLP